MTRTQLRKRLANVLFIVALIVGLVLAFTYTEAAKPVAMLLGLVAWGIHPSESRS